MKRISVLISLVFCTMVYGQIAQSEMDEGISDFREKKYENAKAWFEKAAKLGNPDAFYNVGLLYENGLGVQKNIAEAVKWYEQAGGLDHVKALQSLCDIYYNGEGNLPKDYKKAFFWNKKLADKGNVMSMNTIGVMYFYEQGTDAKDTFDGLEKSVYWFKKCLDSDTKTENDEENCKQGLEFCGTKYFNAGLESFNSKNYDDALSNYTKSAAVGISDAMTNLGMMYWKGNGVKTDYDKAKVWFQMAAEAGNKVAAANLKQIENNKAVTTIKVRQEDGSYKEIPWDDNLRGYVKLDLGDLVYEGDIAGKNAHGKGKVIYSEGDRYEGDFVNGMFDGQGKYYAKNGSLIYEGQYKEFRKNGKGIYYYLGTDAKYDGHWKDDLENGAGTFYSSSGVFQGNWINGEKQGKGKMMWQDGTIYEGNYDKGVLTGEGSITYADGTVSKGIFKDGNASGKWLYTRKDGTTEERFYQTPGIYSVYVKNQSPVEKTRFNDDKLYSEWWDKTYGRGTQLNLPNNNNSSSSFQIGKESEADRHRREMDKIIWSTQKQMERSFKY